MHFTEELALFQIFSLISDSIVSECPREVQFKTFSKNSRNVQLLVDELGYTFSNAHVLKDNNVRWRCSRKSSKEKCRAYAITNNQWLIRDGHAHNHPPGSQDLRSNL